jgi:hypothetical protein
VACRTLGRSATTCIATRAKTLTPNPPNPIAVATNKPRRFSGGAWLFIARWLSVNAYYVARYPYWRGRAT